MKLDLSIHSLQDQYRRKLLTPQHVVKYILQCAQASLCDNIWITLLSEPELQVYLDRLPAEYTEELPLYGVPFAIKDNIDLAGVPTTAGCAEFAYVPDQSAFVVQRLIDAGAIPIGKTNLDQFATGLVGIRSPYGATVNSFNPEYISGGSSSGSAVAVAKGLVSFSLGTDTAGSGRIPAAFNNLIGVKPTRGLISTRGVVPACRTLDCVSLFALNPDDARRLSAIMQLYDALDPFARVSVVGQSGAARTFKFGVPAQDQWPEFADPVYAVLFQKTIDRLKSLNGEAVEIDFSAFIESAKLLYEGPWVAERYAAIADFITENPEALFPVTREIIAPADQLKSVDAFQSIYQLQVLKRRADHELQKVDFVITPTAAAIYTIDQINQQPINLNSKLGFYTNFMNLLDYSAIAIPAGFRDNGLPFGVTLFASAFEDEQLLDYAELIIKNDAHFIMGATDFHWSPADRLPEIDHATNDTMKLVVCGAHLSGMPLNHQLTERGASLVASTKTAACYRFYALEGGPPFRPGLVLDKTSNKAIEVEVWAMPIDQVGSFVAGIPAPLGIGSVILADGSMEKGFICEPCALTGAKEISHLSGWRNYIKSLGN